MYMYMLHKVQHKSVNIHEYGYNYVSVIIVNKVFNMIFSCTGVTIPGD